MLFGILSLAFTGRIPGGWLAGMFILLACASPILVLLLRRLADDLQFSLGRMMASVASVITVPILAAALFFLNALTHEPAGWNPAPSEAAVATLVWLGAILLPACAWRLLRAIS
jgi:hypothetical protein